MRHWIFVFIIAVHVSACVVSSPTQIEISTPTPKSVSEPTPNTTTDDVENLQIHEQAIYSQLINKDADFLVITENSLDRNEDIASFVDYLRQNVYLPKIQDETLDDLLKKNSQSYLLQDYFSPDIPHVFLTNTEERKIFNNVGDEWKRFYDKYPNADGLISFSRIGFNSSLTQAVVYMSVHFGYAAGSGDLILLMYEDEEWVYKKSFSIWIS